ncbi:MAG: D-alanyl-D-alanine carboxypeptidase, partial [Bacilli bacterium]|nr:D-alanyl-D-alanine carboxypeptidase [Bacilli bacterium]
VLFKKNESEKLSVASLTKMMVQIIVLENIESGKIKWDDEVITSSNASGMGGTQIWLSTGEKMSVRDLFKGLSIASANDATVALCEYIAGSEESFVKLMNDKAKDLGLKDTTFVNCTGLDEEGHLSSARDLSIIAKELVSHEEIFEFSSLYEDYIRVNTPNKYWLVNTNKLVRFYEGCDGLKTGFTDNAGYTMAVTAKRGNLRLIAIVLGEKESKIRNSETSSLLDYGFNNYKIDLIKEKGEVVEKINIDKGNKDSVDVVLKEDLKMLNKKSSPSINYDFEIQLNDISLPLEKNEKVGTINLIDNGKIIKSVDLISNDKVEKIGYFKYLINGFLSLF